MHAICVRREDRTPARIERARPEPGPDEALVRTLRVGIDGTHGGFPTATTTSFWATRWSG